MSAEVRHHLFRIRDHKSITMVRKYRDKAGRPKVAQGLGLDKELVHRTKTCETIFDLSTYRGWDEGFDEEPGLPLEVLQRCALDTLRIPTLPWPGGGEASWVSRGEGSPGHQRGAI